MGIGLTAAQRRENNLACARRWKEKNKAWAKKLTAEWYQKNKERWLTNNRNWNKGNRAKRKQYFNTWRLANSKRMSEIKRESLDKIQTFLNGLKREIGCQAYKCGVRDARALEWAHITPRRGSPAISSITSWATLWKELDKCFILCANHHHVYDFDMRTRKKIV